MSRPALLVLAVLAASAASAQAPRYEGPRLDGFSDLAGPLPLPAAADSTAPPDDWIARDKALHAGASFLLTLAGQYVLTDKATLSNGDALPVAAGSALALGLLKEVADAQRPRHPHFCWRDLAADAAGVALAALVVGL